MMHGVVQFGQLAFEIGFQESFILAYPGLQALAAVVRESSREDAAR
jgi:hypothetical protein